MNRNVAVILFVSTLFGLSFGAYDFVLPFYLAERGMSYARMGNVFALASASVVLVRVVMGRLSDVWGRKGFYSVGLIGSAAANALTPLAATVPGLAALKALREAAALTRDTMQSVLLYAENKKSFLTFIGKSRGLETLSQAGGTLVAGLLIAAWGSPKLFFAAGALALLAYFVFAALFHERPDPGDEQMAPAETNIFSFDLSPELRIVTLTATLVMLGVSISHCFIMPLFFVRKFGADERLVGVVLTLHRLAFAASLLLFSGRLGRYNQKNLFMLCVGVQGLTTVLAAVIPHFWASALVWLLHDLLGAGVWSPIQSTLVQVYSRDASRGLDVGKSLALSSLGGIAGPYIAGMLAPISISAPFLASGIVTMVAAPMLLPLQVENHVVVNGGEPLE
jgi:MFS family permease